MKFLIIFILLGSLAMVKNTTPAAITILTLSPEVAKQLEIWNTEPDGLNDFVKASCPGDKTDDPLCPNMRGQRDLYDTLLLLNGKEFDPALFSQEMQDALVDIANSYAGKQDIDYTITATATATDRSTMKAAFDGWADSLALTVDKTPLLTKEPIKIASAPSFLTARHNTQWGIPNANCSTTNWTQGAGDGNANWWEELAEGFGAGRGKIQTTNLLFISIVDDATVGTVAWTNPGNAQQSDNIYATAVLLLNNISHYLKATNGVIAGGVAELVAVDVIIERSALLSTGGRDNSLRLVNASSVVVGKDLADTATNWTTSDSTITYHWGLDDSGLVGADIGSTNSGVVFSAKNTNALSNTMSVDAYSWTIYYRNGADDGPTFWQSPSSPANEAIKVTTAGIYQIDSPTTGAGNSDQTLSVRYKKSASAGQQIDFTYALQENVAACNDTQRVSTAKTDISTTWTTDTTTLTQTQSNSVVRWDLLGINGSCNKVGGGAGRRCFFSTAEVQAKDAPDVGGG